MQQTERLLKIVNLLRRRRTVFTAQQLARKTGGLGSYVLSGHPKA